MPNPEIGFLQFMPIASFNDPTRGFDREAAIEGLLGGYTPIQKQPTVADWPPVREAILRAGVFVVETTTLLFKARISFCPKAPETGDFEIRYTLRGKMEKGRTTMVKEVPAGETDRRVIMLSPFITRYLVFTVGVERPTQLAWLIGLNSYRKVEETGGFDE